MHIMNKFLIAIYRPNDVDPARVVDETMSRDIDALNNEMKAAGVTVFVGGLRPTISAKAVRRQSDDTVIITEGQYLVSPEYMDGFWVLEATDLEEALNWGRKAAKACRASVEVRPFY